ncbi:MAG: hypothetical protein PHD76_08900 [Methylacidiphilales bacterium]|nr:hypothetical protein [Candidatus Methylacidiphilales bacterium]
MDKPIIKARSGEQELLQSGWLQPRCSDEPEIAIGAVTLAFRFINSNDAKKQLEARREADHKNLRLVYILDGQIPPSPLSFGTLSPEPVGTVQGRELFLGFRLSKFTSESPTIDLMYSIYLGRHVSTPLEPKEGK